MFGASIAIEVRRTVHSLAYIFRALSTPVASSHALTSFGNDAASFSEISLLRELIVFFAVRGSCMRK